MPQIVMPDEAGAAAGAAQLAAQGVGVEIRHADPASTRLAVTPNASLQSLYDERYLIYRATYERTRPLIAALDGETDHLS